MHLKNTFREVNVSTRIALINSFPKLVGWLYRVFWRPKNPIEVQISTHSKAKSGFQFLQIGANDGIINDPILKFILRDDWSGIRVEPLPVPFKKLQRLHASNTGVKTAQEIIADRDGKMPLYYLSFSDKRWATGLASLDRSSLERQIDNGHVKKRAAKFGDILPKNRSEWITNVELDVVEVNQFIKDEFSGKLNLLQIDTEGFDHVLVNALHLDELEIDMICFEKLHIPKDAVAGCLERLRKFGYSLLKSDMDILAYR
jgi:FkbM family methyltransferase